MKLEESDQKLQRERIVKMKCSYCGKEYDLHKGMTVVMADGKALHFCSGKCRKNQKMKRRSVKWIKGKKKIKKKK